jgi:hypothetical protein
MPRVLDAAHQTREEIDMFYIGTLFLSFALFEVLVYLRVGRPRRRVELWCKVGRTYFESARLAAKTLSVKVPDGWTEIDALKACGFKVRQKTI